MTYLIIDGNAFRHLVKGEEHEWVGGIVVRMSDIGFNVMRQIIDDAEREKLQALDWSPEDKT